MEKNDCVCLICGKTLKNKRGLLIHVHAKHNLTPHEYKLQFDLYKKCKMCGALILGRGKSGFCNKHYKNGENNPFFGKTHKKTTVDSIKQRCKIASTELWKNEEYREKVIKNSSKPRSEKAKQNISNALILSYEKHPELKIQRREVMLKRINEGYDPTHERHLIGEGWGENSVFNNIPCASKLERKRLEFLYSQSIVVKGYVRNDFDEIINYLDYNNILRIYFPDFIVDNFKYVEEIKYSSNLTSNNLSKYKAAFIFFKKIGIKYYAVTEKTFNRLPEDIYNNMQNINIRKMLNLY